MMFWETREPKEGSTTNSLCLTVLIELLLTSRGHSVTHPTPTLDAERGHVLEIDDARWFSGKKTKHALTEQSIA